MPLSFANESIDVFVTQDVFEHVTCPDDGFREIARVLRPGGAHVFTVPIYQRPEKFVRVDSSGRGLMKADFHEAPREHASSFVNGDSTSLNT